VDEPQTHRVATNSGKITFCLALPCFTSILLFLTLNKGWNLVYKKECDTHIFFFPDGIVEESSINGGWVVQKSDRKFLSHL
jgi:hypothetical protein